MARCLGQLDRMIDKYTLNYYYESQLYPACSQVNPSDLLTQALTSYGYNCYNLTSTLNYNSRNLRG